MASSGVCDVADAVLPEIEIEDDDEETGEEVLLLVLLLIISVELLEEAFDRSSSLFLYCKGRVSVIEIWVTLQSAHKPD